MRFVVSLFALGLVGCGLAGGNGSTGFQGSGGAVNSTSAGVGLMGSGGAPTTGVASANGGNGAAGGATTTGGGMGGAAASTGNGGASASSVSSSVVASSSAASSSSTGTTCSATCTQCGYMNMDTSCTCVGESCLANAGQKCQCPDECASGVCDNNTGSNCHLSANHVCN
jgi:hypothetical protein